jgi:hypothetical protein
MQSSSSQTNKGYAPGLASASGSSSTTTGTTGLGAGYAPGVEQRLREMGTGVERVVTNETISDQRARQPVQEYTEFIEKPKVEQPTQYVTEQRVMEQQQAPIKLKQQEIQQVEQKTVIQEQPVIIKKQEVQIEKERPIEVVKHTTQHQTLPAIEKKELIIQPVQHTAGMDRTVTKTTTEAGMPVEYSVKAESNTAQAIASGDSHKHSGVVEHIKETVGGAKAAAQGVIETAREKAREVFHSGSSQKTAMDTTTSSSTTTQTNLPGSAAYRS